MEEKTKRGFSLYNLASGKPGKKFTKEEFYKILEEMKYKRGGHQKDYSIELDDGYIYHGDSKQEITVIKKLLSRKSFKCLRGQMGPIPYRFAGKNHNYYPDMVLLSSTNKVIFIEVKEVAQMNAKENVKKYQALKRYCERKGYLYMMCDKKFNTYERLNKDYVMPSVVFAIEEALEKKGCFVKEDYDKLIIGADHKKKNKIRKSIGVYIATHKNKVKQVGDLNFDSARFRIRRIKN